MFPFLYLSYHKCALN